MRLSPHPYTLRQLQYLVAVAEAGSFRKAAERCHVAQPSISSQIQHLEEALGLTLFERGSRQARPTAAGAQLVAQARQLLLAADGILEAAAGLTDPFAMTLRLGVIPTVGPYLLPVFAKAIAAAFPKLTVHWVEDRTPALVARLASGELEGAVLALESEAGSLDHEPIGKDPFVLAASKGHPLARGKGPISRAALRGESVLLLDDGHCFRDQALDFCAKTGAQETAFRATSLSTLSQMAASGAAVTLLPQLSLGVENRQGDLVVRRLQAPEPSRTLALCWRARGSLRPTLSAVGAQMRKAYAASCRTDP